MSNTPLISAITNLIKADKLPEIVLMSATTPNFNGLTMNIPSALTTSDKIFNRAVLKMKKISLLQISIIYGAKKCFDYLLSFSEEDYTNSGRTSLHLAASRLEEYYIDQLLKKWGDNDIWINIRSRDMNYTALSLILSIEDNEFTFQLFNEGNRTIEEVQDLKVKITEIFMGYKTVNVLLQDVSGSTPFRLLENSPSDNKIKNMLGSHISMGDYQNNLPYSFPFHTSDDILLSPLE